MFTQRAWDKVQRGMSLTALLIEIPSEALHLQNGNQPNRPSPFTMASSCPKPLGLIHQIVSFLKDLNSPTTECQRTQASRCKIINVYGMNAQAHMNKWISEEMNRERKSKRFDSLPLTTIKSQN